MGTLWRSETMEFVQLVVQLEGAHDMVDELGKLGMVEFREYVRFVCRRGWNPPFACASRVFLILHWVINSMAGLYSES